MVTRELLEDILNNKPYGAGKDFIRSAKNKKMFRYRAAIVQKVVLGSVDIEVFSTEKDAFQSAKEKLRQEHKIGSDTEVVWAKGV